MDKHIEIKPCVLQDICPLGPLSKKDRNKETDVISTATICVPSSFIFYWEDIENLRIYYQLGHPFALS